MALSQDDQKRAVAVPDLCSTIGRGSLPPRWSLQARGAGAAGMARSRCHDRPCAIPRGNRRKPSCSASTPQDLGTRLRPPRGSWMALWRMKIRLSAEPNPPSVRIITRIQDVVVDIPMPSTSSDSAVGTGDRDGLDRSRTDLISLMRPTNAEWWYRDTQMAHSSAGASFLTRCSAFHGGSSFMARGSNPIPRSSWWNRSCVAESDLVRQGGPRIQPSCHISLACPRQWTMTLRARRKRNR